MSACGTSTGIFPSLYDNLCNAGGTTPAIRSVSDVLIIVANITRILIAISGALAIVIILVAAVYYIISGGDPGRVKKAKDILVSTVIGLVLVMAAYAIVTFIAGEF